MHKPLKAKWPHLSICADCTVCMYGTRKAADARAFCACCRLAINKSVKQLTGDGGESGVEPMSILPTAQWTRAADLLRHAVEVTEEEQPSAYICVECQVCAVSFLASQTVCLPSSVLG